MSRAVYIGGFGNGKGSAHRVAESLASQGNWEDIDVLTFREAMKENTQNLLHTRVYKVPVITHSAGMIALRDTYPTEIYSVAPPLPESKRLLVGKTCLKTLEMSKGLLDTDRRQSVVGYNRSSIAELATHPYGNLRHLESISNFDSIIAALHAERSGIPVSLTYMDNDAYGYTPDDDDRDFAELHGVDYSVQPGEHDELVLDPDTVLRNVLR